MRRATPFCDPAPYGAEHFNKHRSNCIDDGAPRPVVGQRRSAGLY
jgi:hypothetical protein